MIILSVGHTPSEPGAVAGDLVEFDIAKKIVLEAGNIFKEEKIDVVIVPFDLDLQSVIDWINNSGYSASAGDICIDVHINDGGRSGIEGWYKDRGPNDSSSLAETVSESISKATGLPFLGAKSEYDHPFGFLAFVHNTKPISALIECGYIDNPVDSALMKTADGIKKFARGLVDGIKLFLQKKGKVSGQNEQSRVRGTSSLSTINRSSQTTPTFSSGLGFSGSSYNSRRELIKRLYIEVLGREADAKGLSYYCYSNPDATEDQIRKEMTQSTEHFEILKRAKRANELEDRVKKLEEELNMTRLTLEAKENEISKMNSLLKMKTEEMMRMSKQLQMQAGVVQGVTPPSSTPYVMPGAPNTLDVQEYTLKRRGCLGWLKEILGF